MSRSSTDESLIPVQQSAPIWLSGPRGPRRAVIYLSAEQLLSQPLKAFHLNLTDLHQSSKLWEWWKRGRSLTPAPRGPKHDCSLSSECWWKRLKTWNEDFSETAFSVNIIYIYRVQNFSQPVYFTFFKCISFILKLNKIIIFKLLYILKWHIYCVHFI